MSTRIALPYEYLYDLYDPITNYPLIASQETVRLRWYSSFSFDEWLECGDEDG